MVYDIATHPHYTMPWFFDLLIQHVESPGGTFHGSRWSHLRLLGLARRGCQVVDHGWRRKCQATSTGWCDSMIFPFQLGILGMEFHHINWLIFFKGVATPPTSVRWDYHQIGDFITDLIRDNWGDFIWDWPFNMGFEGMNCGFHGISWDSDPLNGIYPLLI